MSRIRFTIVADWPNHVQGPNIWSKQTPTPPAGQIIKWLSKILGRRFGVRVVSTNCEAVATAGKEPCHD
jgi:hypothetical protein